VTGEVLLSLTIDVPLAMLAACISRDMRERMPALLPFAPLPALAAVLFAPAGSTLVLPDALLGLTFVLDLPGAIMLGGAALLWVAAGVYARTWLRRRPNQGAFAVWWLMTLTGSLGIFIVADLVGFYLFFTLVSLSAYGLVVFEQSAEARRAAGIYVAFALLGEAFLLMGFVLLASQSPDGSLLIRDAVAALAVSPWRDAAMALLVLGFGVKIGLVPLHVWMPLAYTAAPIPAAAVLSGTAVKAGVIGLIRFLPLDASLPGWGEALVVAGFFSAFYGVAIGITQSNPKTVLAYSSVSQMGVIAALLGMGLAAGDRGVAIAAAFYALHHIFVKGGLFLAIGVADRMGSRKPWPVLLPAAVIALGLGGLPLTGGALAKLVTKAPFGDGVAGALAVASAVASTVLMLHFLRCLLSLGRQDGEQPARAGLTLPWLAVALAAVAVPWIPFPAVAETPAVDALAPAVLWEGLWPVLLGGLFAAGLYRVRYALPNIPPGDLIAIEGRAAAAGGALGAEMQRLDYHMRQWPVAGLLFLALTLVMAAAMLVGR